jgi:hypothetical protein
MAFTRVGEDPPVNSVPTNSHAAPLHRATRTGIVAPVGVVIEIRPAAYNCPLCTANAVTSESC